MAKRFQTYFGIPVPPFKEKKLGAGSVTIRFVLQGPVPSKKNSQQGVAVRKKAYEFLKGKKSLTNREAVKAVKLVFAKVRPNNEYRAFVEAQKPIIGKQMEWWSNRLQSKGLIFPLRKASMTLRFYFAGRHVQDTVNKQQSIQDLLIESLVIANDDYKTLNPIHSSSECYHEEITENITFVSLSFRL